MTQAAPQGPGFLSAEELYRKVPWYRRSGHASAMMILGLLLPGLGYITMPAVCIIALTGPIYWKRLERPGELKKWSKGNIVAAWILLPFYLIFWTWYLVSRF